LTEVKKIRIALIDLYNNEENRDIGCIENILRSSDRLYDNIPVGYEIYNTRYSGTAPDSGYDIYISSGGPGSPWDGSGSRWESAYFSLLDSIWSHNQNEESKKYFFFICHSFQMMTRYFKLGDVVKKNKESFGIVPVVKTPAGEGDLLLEGLGNPFYAADFRNWQAVNPDLKMFGELGAQILSVEAGSSGTSSEQAMMAIRISKEFAGTQFHPEIDAANMRQYLSLPVGKNLIINNYGERKYNEMLDLAGDPAGIMLTHKVILPNFLRDAIKKLRF